MSHLSPVQLLYLTKAQAASFQPAPPIISDGQSSQLGLDFDDPNPYFTYVGAFEWKADEEPSAARNLSIMRYGFSPKQGFAYMALFSAGIKVIPMFAVLDQSDGEPDLKNAVCIVEADFTRKEIVVRSIKTKDVAEERKRLLMSPLPSIDDVFTAVRKILEFTLPGSMVSEPKQLKDNTFCQIEERNL